MPKDSIVLIDTSVWIDYFSNKDSRLRQAADSLLDSDLAATAAIIVAELAQGARDKREIDTIKDYFKPLHWIESSDGHWGLAGELSFRMKKEGRNVNLTDCYIAELANSASAVVFSCDKHFSWIAELGGCELFPLAMP